ncbi:MAG: type II toxin-antitoxin system VapC family toxin [Rhizobiales bacterium]|nr:type II toxin-antitoxin system VapC family toxin [Hyphomicrobiales bacterium]MBN9010567.1 type II toxin-antitoxin system VapC family toxin [Hyphomicrobiales bacterium]
MILPDVNVLVHAFRKEAPEHPLCNSWLNAALQALEPFGISPLALSAVVRITSNTRTLPYPSTFEEIFRFTDYLTSQPHCRLVTPGERHWDIFRRLCIETNTRGPRVTDAWYAALAIEAGATFVTLDRDLARFPGLRWEKPS